MARIRIAGGVLLVLDRSTPKEQGKGEYSEVVFGSLFCNVTLLQEV